MNTRQLLFRRWKTTIAFAMVLIATVFSCAMFSVQRAEAITFQKTGNGDDDRKLVEIMSDKYSLKQLNMDFSGGWVLDDKKGGNVYIKSLKNETDGNADISAVVVKKGENTRGAKWHITSKNCFSYFDKDDMSKKKGSIRYDFTLEDIKTDKAGGDAAVAYITGSQTAIDSSAFNVSGSRMFAIGGVPAAKETVKVTFIDSEDKHTLTDDEVPPIFWGFYDIDIWDKYTYGGLDSQEKRPTAADDASLAGHPYAETVDLQSGFKRAYRRRKGYTVYMTGSRIFPTQMTNEDEGYRKSAAIASLKAANATIVWTGSCCSTGIYSMSTATLKGSSVTKQVSKTNGNWGDEAYLGAAGDEVYYKITIQLPKVDHNIDPTPYSSIVVRDRLDWLTTLDDVSVKAGSTGGAGKWTAARIGDTRSIKFTYKDVAHANALTANTADSDRQLVLIFSTKTKTADKGKDDTSVANPNDEDPPAGDGKAHTHPKNYKRRKSKQKDGKTYRKLYNKAHVYLDSDEETTSTVNPWVPLPITQVNIVITKEADDSKGVFGDGGMNVTKTGAIYQIDKVTKVGNETKYEPEKRHDTFFFKTNASDDAARPPEFTNAVLDAASPPNPHPYYSDNDPEGTVDIGEGGENDAGFGVGTYRITELHAPNGFFNASGGKQTQTITITQEDVDNGETKYVTFSNPRPVGKIHLKKVIPDSRCSYQIKNLAGNTFDIYAADNVYNPRDGSVKYAAGTKITTVTTDTNGDALTGDLPVGSYKAIETSAAPGLLRNRDWITGLNITLGDWADTVSDASGAYGEHINYPTLTRFRKLSELTDTTNTQKGLAGAHLQVLDPSAANAVVAEGTTDGSGIFTASGLQIDHDYIVHESVPAPNYTAAPDQHFRTTTQSETDSTQIVGINTYWYDNWSDYGYGYNTAQATGTRLIDVPEYYTLKLYKRIDASDPWISHEQNSYGHGEPTFLFKIDGTDFRGQHVAYYRTFTFRKNEIDAAGHSGWLEHERDVKVRAGTYTVTEVKSMRYKVTEVHRHENATVNGQSATVTLDVNHPSATVGFTNRTTNYNDWSHVHVAVNGFQNAYANSDSTHHPMAQERDETENKVQ